MLWGSNGAASSNGPKFYVIPNYNPANSSGTNSTTIFSNSTPGAFVPGQIVGVYGSTNAQANGMEGAGKKYTVPGWYVVKRGMGGVTSVLTGNQTSSQYANGMTLHLTGGTGITNAVAVAQTNATGNMVGWQITTPGLFANVGGITANTLWFEKWVSAMAVGNALAVVNVTLTGATTLYNNTDFWVISNGIINAVATVTTNSIGGISNASTWVFTTGGVFGNAMTNTQCVVSAFAANGAASNGTGGSALTVKLAANVILGYANTDYVLVSNGIYNAKVTFTTNATGGTLSSLTVANVGLFSNAVVTNTTSYQGLSIVAYAANGALSNGEGTFWTPTFANSTVANQVLTFTLGGRAGRIRRECLVVMSSMTANTTVANSTTSFP